jgi:RsiW-degrading membrane proteinase PrsW (M82 family)
MSSTLTFLVTLLVLSAAGTTSSDPTEGEVVDYDSGVVRQPRHPGERAYEAGQGVALSVALMALVIFRRRHLYNVQISSGLLSHYAIRGATMSACIASGLEIVGVLVLKHITGLDNADLMPTPEKYSGGFSLLPVAVTMALVGASEELAKASAVMLGAWLVAGAMRLDPPSCCQKLRRVLVESPRALMLAGLAVGCGFMTIENVGYLLSAGLMYDKDDSVAAERIVRCIIVGVRVGLNLHPWLAGITAARMAQVTFGQGRESLTFSFKEFVWVLWPASALHAAFDFGLVGLPGVLAMFLPICSWLGARAIFNQEWDKYETSRASEADPSEELTAQQSG